MDIIDELKDEIANYQDSVDILILKSCSYPSEHLHQVHGVISAHLILLKSLDEQLQELYVRQK